MLNVIVNSSSVRERIINHVEKIVVYMDHLDFGRDGIIHKNIIDFLLETVS